MAFGGHRVVAVTPAGRRRYLRVLVPHVLRARGLLDEYQLWVNTADPRDIRYLLALADAHPGFVRLVWPREPPRMNRTVGGFYRRCLARDTVYVKLDDDVCFVEPGALEELVRFRLQHRRFLLVYPNIINTVVSSSALQELGMTSPRFRFGRERFCPTGWGDGRAAASVHRLFLDHAGAGDLEPLKSGCLELPPGTAHSIVCVAWLGDDLARFGGRVEHDDDELWLAVDLPRRLGRTNCIWGRSIVVHFAYRDQRAFLEDETDLLSEYAALAAPIAP